MRLTRYIISNSQFSHHAFPHLKIARGNRPRHSTFFAEILVDRNLTRMLDLQWTWPGTWSAHTMQGLCESAAWSLVTSAAATHYVPLSIMDDISPLCPLPVPQRGVPTASHFGFYHPVTSLSNIKLFCHLFIHCSSFDCHGPVLGKEPWLFRSCLPSLQSSEGLKSDYLVVSHPTMQPS